MRVLVVAETSGASRSALETVMTDTPARSAMSLRRTMSKLGHRGTRPSPFHRPLARRRLSAFSQWRSAPVQFAAQRFAKRTADQVHQAHSAAAAAHRHGVTRRHLADDLAIGA